MKLEEIKAKSIITKSKLPDTDYVVNPYTGCQFACMYCYASFMGRFVNEPIENWGNYVYVKTNAVELFEKELVVLQRNTPQPSILFSSVTDPYLGAEMKYRLTGRMLDILARERYKGTISVLTKSPMVLRDIDVLKKIPNAEVGMTVTTTNDKVSRFLEVRAPPASARLLTLKKLHDSGLNTYAFVGPLLPHFRYQEKLLDELFAALVKSGVKEVYVEQMNLKPYIKKRLWQVLDNEPKEVQEVYAGASTKEHRDVLDKMVSGLLKKHGLKLRMNQVLYHEEVSIT